MSHHVTERCFDTFLNENPNVGDTERGSVSFRKDAEICSVTLQTIRNNTESRSVTTVTTVTFRNDSESRSVTMQSGIHDYELCIKEKFPWQITSRFNLAISLTICMWKQLFSNKKWWCSNKTSKASRKNTEGIVASNPSDKWLIQRSCWIVLFSSINNQPSLNHDNGNKESWKINDNEKTSKNERCKNRYVK